MGLGPWLWPKEMGLGPGLWTKDVTRVGYGPRMSLGQAMDH